MSYDCPPALSVKHCTDLAQVSSVSTNSVAVSSVPLFKLFCWRDFVVMAQGVAILLLQLNSNFSRLFVYTLSWCEKQLIWTDLAFKLVLVWKFIPCWKIICFLKTCWLISVPYFLNAEKRVYDMLSVACILVDSGIVLLYFLNVSSTRLHLGSSWLIWFLTYVCVCTHMLVKTTGQNTVCFLFLHFFAHSDQVTTFVRVSWVPVTPKLLNLSL